MLRGIDMYAKNTRGVLLIQGGMLKRFPEEDGGPGYCLTEFMLSEGNSFYYLVVPLFLSIGSSRRRRSTSCPSLFNFLQSVI